MVVAAATAAEVDTAAEEEADTSAGTAVVATAADMAADTAADTVVAATAAAMVDKEASTEAAAMGVDSRWAMAREVPITVAGLATAMGSTVATISRAILATGERLLYWLFPNQPSSSRRTLAVFEVCPGFCVIF